jgi:mono/diheme cytochrome c family protein
MFRALVFMAALALAGMATAISARAADADNGKRLAQSHCAPCHIVAPHAHNEVADAPSFEVVGRKYGFDTSVITQVIAGPHPKMNFAPRPPDAADIAAYIATLKQ